MRFLVACMLLTASSAVAADLSGTWMAEQAGRGRRPPTATYHYFKLDGNTFTDTMARTRDRRAIVTGKLQGDMVTSGMRDAGYIYVNIDDTWEAGRDPQGNILTNDKSPDMKALADYVHSKGLKLGIYSSPGRLTCAGFTGSYGHEEQDAKTFAA